MLLFSALPFWVFHAILLAGVLGLITSIIIKYIPVINVYHPPLQLLSWVVIIAGVFFEGAILNQGMWEKKVSEMEKKVAIAEEKAGKVNEVVRYKFIDKVQVVRDTQVVVQEKIREVGPAIDKICVISPDVVDILNIAARNAVLNMAKPEPKVEVK